MGNCLLGFTRRIGLSFSAGSVRHHGGKDC